MKKKSKHWPLWVKISLVLLSAFIVIGTAITVWGYYFTKDFNDDSSVYYAKKKSCGHNPYLATPGAELGGAQAALITATQPNQESWLGRRGYYCTVQEAQQSGLYVISVDGRPIQPTK